MSENQNEPEVYTVEEVATRFKVHPETIRRLIKQKKLDAFKFSGEWRIKTEALERYLKSVGGRAA